MIPDNETVHPSFCTNTDNQSDSEESDSALSDNTDNEIGLTRAKRASNNTEKVTNNHQHHTVVTTNT